MFWASEVAPWRDPRLCVLSWVSPFHTLSVGMDELVFRDVVYRDNATGELVPRWNLLWDRLDPYVNNSIHPVVVLDNIPYCFVAQPSLGVYGQTKGPDNPEEYGEFIEMLLRQLVARYGVDRVSGFTFRVATEPNNPSGHWNDTVTKFLDTYAAVAGALKRVVPMARVGPGNWCPCNRSSPDPYLGFAEQAMAGLAARRLPVDFIAASFYGGSGQPVDSHYSVDRAAVAAAFIQGQRALYPAFQNASLQFMEYGNLGNEAGRVSNEPGSFGAAWTLATTVQAAAHGVSRLFHWDDFSSLSLGAAPGADDLTLAHANLWLATVGQRAPRGTLRCLGEPGPGASRFGLWLESASEASAWLLLAAFVPERGARANLTLEAAVPCPGGAGGAWRVAQLLLDRTTSPLDLALGDLEAVNGTLFNDGLPYGLNQLANARGAAYLRAHAERYRAAQRASLAWQPFQGTLVEKAGGMCHLSYESRPHAVRVLYLERVSRTRA